MRKIITEEAKNAIYNAIRIEEVIGDFVQLRRNGAAYKGLCPFHNEKTPSFIVTPAKGIFKCFGCGAGGDAVAFIKKHENINYGEALLYLAKKYNIEVEEKEWTPEQIQLLKEKEAIYTVLNFAKDYFIDYQNNTDEGKSLGLSYWKERQFSPSVIEKFQLGFAPSDRTTFQKAAAKSGYTIDNLIHAGLVTVKEDGSTSDKFHGRAIFPIHNFSGKVIAFGGRILSSKADSRTPRYLNSPETEVFHKSDIVYGLYFAKNAIRKEDRCFLVEGYTDVISLYQAGIENVVSSSGTSLTSGQIQLIGKLTQNITVIYDGDSAGIKAAFRSVPLLLNEGMSVRIVILPPEDDPDSFAKNHSRQECIEFIEQNEKSFVEFKTHFLLKEVGNDILKRSKVADEIASDVACVTDPITRALYVRECALILEVPEDVFANKVATTVRKKYHEARAKAEKQEKQAEMAETVAFVDHEPAPHPQFFHPPFAIIDHVEKAILKLLVNYGSEIIHQKAKDFEQTKQLDSMRVDQFIIKDLIDDKLFFANKLHHKFFMEYMNYADKYQNDIGRHLQEHPTKAVRELYVELLDIPAQCSPKWEAGRIQSYIRPIDSPGALHEDALRTVKTLKVVKLKKLLNKKINELKAAAPDDEAILLYECADLTQRIKKIEAIVGVVYRSVL
ncbi:MAG: DNA primase [Bacteroidales bacterium]|jgi:DNA primase|nr:DNA primase [Bacteroidales bacterium]